MTRIPHSLLGSAYSTRRSGRNSPTKPTKHARRAEGVAEVAEAAAEEVAAVELPRGERARLKGYGLELTPNKSWCGALLRVNPRLRRGIEPQKVSELTTKRRKSPLAGSLLGFLTKAYPSASLVLGTCNKLLVQVHPRPFCWLLHDIATSIWCMPCKRGVGGAPNIAQ